MKSRTLFIHVIYARKGGFPLSRNFYVRTDVNFNCLTLHCFLNATSTNLDAHHLYVH